MSSLIKYVALIVYLQGHTKPQKMINFSSQSGIYLGQCKNTQKYKRCEVT